MCLLMFFNEVEGLGTKGDYPPGTITNNSAHMDIFMALFMICAIEVILVKMWMFDNSQSDDRRRSVQIFIEGDSAESSAGY